MSTTDKKSNLTEIRRGYYISKSDPYYWRKLLRFKPDDSKAQYQVALEYEEEAKRNLHLYDQTKKPSFLQAYLHYLEKALFLTRKAATHGYIQARQECLRIEELIKGAPDSNLSNPPHSQKVSLNSHEDLGKSTVNRRAGLIILGLIALLLIVFFMFELLKDKPSFLKEQLVIHNTFASFIPYQVKEEKPTLPPQLQYHENHFFYNPSQSLPLTDSLLNKMKEAYKNNPSLPLKISALDPNNGSEIGVAVWNDPKSGIEIYIYPESQVHPLLFENITVLRSALFQYALDKGYFPTTLSELTGPSPENYLSSIPKEPHKAMSQENPTHDGFGGWEYAPQNVHFDSKDLKLQVTEIIKPNLNGLQAIPFEPLKIVINKASNKLTLKSGDILLRSYPVALGKDNSTPEGEFSIQKKITHPNKDLMNSPFGTRGMELSNPLYAIHGTDDPSSIGKNVSQGCIRLNNEDIEELYSLVPLGTPVKIINDATNTTNLKPPTSQTKNPFITTAALAIEEDPSRIYYWSN